MFAQRRKTPFIHPRLYESHLPDAIQDAFSVSASYCMKSAETEDTVHHILENKTGQLVKQDYQALSLDGLLAAVHALMLFQIMQLFDENIRQHPVAEQNQQILRTWTLELQLRINNLEPPSTWEGWIFLESVRRTIIFSTIIDDLYTALNIGFYTLVPTMKMLTFTHGPGMWEASSSNSWLSESHRSEYTPISYGQLALALKAGQLGGKLDYFEKLLLTPCLGERHREILELDD